MKKSFRAVLFAALMLLLPLFSVLLVSAIPSEVALACNPCDCPDDKRINCQGIDEYAVYPRTSNGTCNIDVYLINGNTTRRVFRATAAEIARVGDAPERNTLIDSYYEVALYRLTSGEFQVNYGPSRLDGKIYELIWTGCPAESIRENNYVP